MALHKSGKTRVVPIIVRPIEWERLVFGGLASLPRGEAVSMWPKTMNRQMEAEALGERADAIQREHSTD